ncbi:MAG: DNA recombination protein RmuC [Vampirovibrionales bacterium]|nr:DNA recombination protein RmuC [Vampirovibrionales bacterium]
MWDVSYWIPLAACLGLAGMLFWFSSKLSQERQKTQTLTTQLSQQEQSLQEMSHNLDASREALSLSRQEAASLRATLEATVKSERQLAEQQQAFHQQLIDHLKIELNQQVQNSQKTLAQQSHHASQVASEHLLQQLKQVVAPLSEKVTAFQAISEKTLSDQGGIKQQLETLHAVTQRLGNALTHNKGRGNWGELELELLLQDSGLTEGHGYQKQPRLPNGTIPDFKLNLSDGRALFIDVKALQWDPNADAHNEVAEPSDDRLSRLQKRHEQSLRAAIEELSKKAYPQAASKNPNDTTSDIVPYVVLYVPRESMLALALESDPNLFQFAYRRNILLAGPFNLMGLLRLVHHGWQVAKLSQEAKEIEKLGVAVHQKSALMFERFAAVGKSIETLNEKFNAAMVTFQGRDSVLSKLKRMEALGCKSDKTLPEDPPFIDEPYVFTQSVAAGAAVLTNSSSSLKDHG